MYQINYNDTKNNIKIYFQIGGYTTPFVVLGSALFLSAIMTWFVLPEHAEDQDLETKKGGNN